MKTLLSLLVLLAPLVAGAQPYPSRPVHFVVGFAAGGFADTVARIFQQKVQERVGQPVVVENRGGAGGSIASKYVAGVAPDGYVILVNTAAMAINASMQKDPGFNAVADFTPVMITASAPEVFAVNASSTAGTLQDLVREHKGKQLTYAHSGVGTSSHLIGEYLFKRLAGAEAVHVPFQGGAPAVTATLSGQVSAISLTLPPMLPHIRSGKLRALAVASKSRIAALPNVPTVAEAGYPELDAGSWVGFFVPAKTDPAVVARLNAVMNEVIALPDVRERFTNLAVEASGGTPPELAAMFRAQVQNWANVVKTTGIKAD
ncbi:MAG TPA: tripartite tricarboxylate transporter substrate binding protein [Burkholderiales bacterium]|nr:tripartite tricarboxylate transporter substrate binding protein [Burkholderiales bacterium]